MELALGIDTGGTYTDAVLVDYRTNEVLKGAKALTTRQDLSIGIRQAISEVLPVESRSQVVLVALSTTLATNALAEGRRGKVCLLLIGYDPDLVKSFGFTHELATSDVVYLAGGHNGLGEEAAPLDLAAARRAILERRASVDAFAISGYYSVRNPAHELQVKALVDELSGLPATCGHELTSRLNSVRRATTVTLNAHLILPLSELIRSVQATLREWDIHAPLMVTKGDGSLVRADWAAARPIETILSGPAASVVGASFLAGRKDVWVVDVGGTTTDIAGLRDGLPRLNKDGAQIGGWRTMVEAVDVRTTGLGGDSHVRLDSEHHLQIGPRRTVPLSLLAMQHPAALEQLRRWAGVATSGDAPEFVLAGKESAAGLSEGEQEVLQQLTESPQLVGLLLHSRRGGLRRKLEALETRQLVQRAAFTPSDALHVLGRYDAWNVEAARLGAEQLAARLRMPVLDFCELVVKTLAQKVAAELASKALEDELGSADWGKQMLAQALLDRATDSESKYELGVSFTLRRPLVAIGAPVAAYLPAVAELLHTELVIPPHAAVANAIGAVAGGIVQRLRAEISPLPESGLIRVHLLNGNHDFEILDDAIAFAERTLLPQVAALAVEGGAEQVQTHIERHIRTAPVADSDEQIFLSAELIFIAAGRPSAVRREA
jgi:N-methylhydantoinase A/oxoprolinase/acetone carboxylase beta subunit